MARIASKVRPPTRHSLSPELWLTRWLWRLGALPAGSISGSRTRRCRKVVGTTISVRGCGNATISVHMEFVRRHANRGRGPARSYLVAVLIELNQLKEAKNQMNISAKKDEPLVGLL